MIGLDTNVLARYYVQDAADAQAGAQRVAAKRLIESGRDLMVCKTVLLEFEWVMRGYYRLSQSNVASVFRHLLALPHVVIEDRDTVELALTHCDAGIDLADALHHASYRDCASVASFDDRKFGRRARALALMPSVSVPV